MRGATHNKLAQLRSVFRVISSEDFAAFYSQVDEAMQNKLAKAIEDMDRDTLIALIRSTRNLHEKTVKQLRLMCKDRNVKNYHLMSKAELLSLLESYREF